jgi:hypothetical protein
LKRLDITSPSKQFMVSPRHRMVLPTIPLRERPMAGDALMVELRTKSPSRRERAHEREMVAMRAALAESADGPEPPLL